MGKRRVQRRRRRHFQIHRWRQDVATINQRSAGQHRAGESSRSRRALRKHCSPQSGQKRSRNFIGQTTAARHGTGTTDDPRPGLGIGGGDLPVVRFDPKNPQIVYSASVVCWKSTDGGKTWDGWRGAPGGDDYQNVWINPNNPDIILLGSDQGAIVTVNGGKSWSSWYNQSTAQLYHVSADNTFPYRLYSGQQESGSVGIKSRGDEGEITFRDWQPVAAEEYGYVVADPLDPDIIIGGKLTRFDRRTGQAQNILPGAGANGRLPDVADRAGCLFAARSAFALLRWKHALANTRPWRSLGKDQPGFVATELRAAGEHWKIQRGRNKAGSSARRDLHRCAVTARRKPNLVRDRRWFDSSHNRRRKNLDQRDAAEHFRRGRKFR